MKKWYQSTVARAVLLLVAIASIAAAFVSFTIIANCAGDFSIQDFFSKEEKTFEETDGFESILHQSVNNSLWQERVRENIETEGKYDPDKLVDIMTYAENSQITGQNESGLAYTIGDLISWYDSMGGDFWSYKNNNIIVCQRPDGTYYYYYTGEFQKLLEDGELKLELDEEYSTRSFLEELNNGYYNDAGSFAGNILLKNKDGETLYTDCWAFAESLDEIAVPVGAKNILEIVNKTEKFNGRLSEIYSNIEFALTSVHELRYSYEDSSNSTFEEGNTNFSYYLLNKETGKVYTNNSAYKKEKNVEKVIEKVKSEETVKYVVVQPKLKDFDTNMEVSAGTWKSVVEANSIVGKNYVFIASVDTVYPIQDAFYENSQLFNKFAPYYNSSVKYFVVSIVLFAVCIVWMTMVAGQKDESGEVKLNKFDRWKTEIAATLVIGIWVLLTAMAGEIIYMTGQQYYYDVYGYEYYSASFIDTTSLVLIGIYGALTAILFFVGYLSLIRRIKARSLWKDSLCRVCIKFTWKWCKVFGEFWRHRSILWKMILVIGIFLFLHWCGFAGAYLAIVLALFAEAAVTIYLLWEAILKERIRKGIRKISEGDVTHEISTDKMIGVNKEIAENVNHIGDGLQNAVNEQMKSERLKTDLITNVSHDIKTPLTSIINYVSLLKMENIEDQKIQGYIQVIDEKAQRLKTLTEDVVEASKVSSGNISLEYMDVNLVEMLSQTIGEFSEKFEAKNLTIVENVPAEPVVVHVDNRRMWRVLENIFNNAAKYSMPGTRVYVDMKKENKKVIFSLKNISEQPLNIDASELTERFIRGDISRSTEGSGLGLSIAKNLTELQGGTFKLYLDGDLFKVNIEFPVK